MKFYKMILVALAAAALAGCAAQQVPEKLVPTNTPSETTVSLEQHTMPTTPVHTDGTEGIAAAEPEDEEPSTTPMQTQPAASTAPTEPANTVPQTTEPARTEPAQPPKESDVSTPLTTYPAETEPPKQESVETRPPATQPSATIPPETKPPETEPLETEPPTTDPPVTLPPATTPAPTVPEETELPRQTIDTAALEAYGRSYASSTYGYEGNSRCNPSTGAGYFPGMRKRITTMEEGYAAVRAIVDCQYAYDCSAGRPITAVVDGVLQRRNINVYLEPTAETDIYIVWCYYGGTAY